jgi:hypothetical protein
MRRSASMRCAQNETDQRAAAHTVMEGEMPSGRRRNPSVQLGVPLLDQNQEAKLVTHFRQAAIVVALIAGASAQTASRRDRGPWRPPNRCNSRPFSGVRITA